MESVSGLIPTSVDARSATLPGANEPAAPGAAGTDGAAAEAFAAALLAQAIVPPVAAAPMDPVPALATAEAVDGQVLPRARLPFATPLPQVSRLLGTLSSAVAESAGTDVDAAAVELALTADDAAAPHIAHARAKQAVQATMDGAASVPDLEATLEAVATLNSARPDTPASALGGSALDAQPIAHTARSADVSASAQSYVGKPAPLPVDQPALFAERLNQQISVMLTGHAQHARIAVNPPDLGPVEVRVVVVGDQATVQLAAPHAATRDALEDALPRLRAAFADSGIALGHAGVFAEMPQRQQQAPEFNGSGSFDEGHPAIASAPSTTMIKLGLIDAFV